MPFEPGHTINLGRSGSNSSHATKRAMKNLALSIREGVHPDEMRDWLLAVWRGKDPLTGDLVDLKTRMQAMQTLKEYGWGMAPQHVIIEAEIRAQMIANDAPLTKREMSLDEINARRAQLREAGVKPKIIDVDGTPTRALVAGSPELEDE
jgi:hypothetical protein